jgi:glycerol kinase
LIGLERGTQPGHIARAALESIAFQVADVIEAMDKETQNPFRELRVDGGAAANDLLMQCQADMIGIPVLRPQQVETTALGAAYLSGLATGFWESPQQIMKLRGEGQRFHPNPDRSRAQQQRERWREAVSRSRGWNQPDNAVRSGAKGEPA